VRVQSLIVPEYNLRQGDHKRTPGVHLSGVLRRIAIKSGILKVDDDEEDLDALFSRYSDGQPGDNAVFNRVALGMAWEDWYGPQIAGADYHPGEYSLDGVIGSPDCVYYGADGGVIVHEIKCTWKSSRKPIEGEWLWMRQVQGYCRMVGTNYACLHVYHVMGDYRGSGPLLRLHSLEFTDEELETTWQLVLRHKESTPPETGR
jgi:hypothetical protein